MRKLKFRAWDTECKLMLDWNVINQSAFNTFNILYEYDYYKKNYENDNLLKHKMLHNVSFLYTIFHNPKFTLMQFIGLQDKNGKDIYEGDIIKRKDSDKIGVIQFARGVFGINWDYKENSNPEWNNGRMYGSWGALHNLRSVDDDILQKFEIIGNIYENPELMENINGNN